MNIQKLFVPLTKSPKPNKGRIGPEQWQDWYRGVKLAAELLQRNAPHAKILLISDVQITGAPHEIQIYLGALRELNVNRTDIIEVWKARETIGQVEEALLIAKERKAELVFISAPLHYPRVRWLCKGTRTTHYIAWGLPRIKEAITDSILIFVFPILDLCGLRAWWLKKVTERRDLGRQ